MGREEIIGGRFVAFCGIGNPGSFSATLEHLGMKPEAFFRYPDHHRYTEGDIRGIDAVVTSTGARFVLTTEKDAVRLAGAAMPRVPFRSRLAAVVVGAVLTEGREALVRAVLGVADRRAA